MINLVLTHINQPPLNLGDPWRPLATIGDHAWKWSFWPFCNDLVRYNSQLWETATLKFWLWCILVHPTYSVLRYNMHWCSVFFKKKQNDDSLPEQRSMQRGAILQFADMPAPPLAKLHWNATLAALQTPPCSDPNTLHWCSNNGIISTFQGFCIPCVKLLISYCNAFATYFME